MIGRSVRDLDRGAEARGKVMFRPGDGLISSNILLADATRLTLYPGLIPRLHLAQRCLFASAWMEEQLNLSLAM